MRGGARGHGRSGSAGLVLTGDVAQVVSLPLNVERLESVEPRVIYAGAGDVTYRGFRLRETGPAAPRP